MQKTFLNELYHQTDENKSTNNNNITSIKRENKNKFNTINKKQKKIILYHKVNQAYF